MAAFTAANLAGKTSNSMVRRWAECLSASVSAFVLCGVGCLMAVLNLQVLYTEKRMVWSFGLDDGVEQLYIVCRCCHLWMD